MAERGAEPFTVALGALRARLRRGAWPPDHRLAAVELAAELRLSATPVREALSRLAGEGLVEDRRGQGVFVRRLGRSDLVALWRLHLSHLVLALEDAPADLPPRDLGPGEDIQGEALEDPIALSEGLFDRWVAAAPRALGLSYRRIADQLAPARRLEPRLFADLAQEAAALAAAGTEVRTARLRAFHQRRVRAADRLADLIERGVAPL